jgi:hypothetical protein
VCGGSFSAYATADKKKWRKQYAADGRHQPVQARHEALKASLGIGRYDPIDSVKREDKQALSG